MYDFVLPLSVHNKWGHEKERVEILRDTFQLHCPDANFLIITPREQIVFWQEIMPEARYAADEDLADVNCRGWQKQQFMKIMACRHVNTDAYCLLDSDIFLSSPIPEKDLKRNGKPVIGLRQAPFKSKILPPAVRGSARYLKTAPLKEAMNFTPAIFSVEAVELLISDLEQKVGENWKEVLALSKPPWTEYTLYLACLRSHGALKDFHSVLNKRLCQNFDTILDLDEKPFRKSMLRVNSYLGIYPGYIRKILTRKGFLRS
jgi:hypothetical protein